MEYPVNSIIFDKDRKAKKHIMINEIEKRIKTEQKKNWKDFKMWVKKEYPFMLDRVKEYDNQRGIPDIIGFLLDEFLQKNLLK